MKKTIKAFASAWSRRWSGAGSGPDGGLQLKDTPAYPLARTVEMPEGHEYPHGALAFRMSDQKLTGIGGLDAERSRAAVDGDRMTLRLVFDRLELGGRYVVEAKADPLVQLDIAGNLMPLPEEALQPVAAGADGIEQPLTPTQEQWVVQAKGQQTKLASPLSPDDPSLQKLDPANQSNGQQCVAAFHEHNDAYVAVFQRANTQTTWAQGDATAQMAQHTSDCDGTSNHVNPPATVKKFGNPGYEGSYNDHSFAQQTSIMTSLAQMSEDAKEPEKTQYANAALAMLNFKNKPVASTGNTPSNTRPMSFDDVHGAVGSYQDDGSPAHTREDLKAYLETDPDAAGAGVDGSGSGRLVLSETEREIARRTLDAYHSEEAANAAIVGEPLFEGACAARIEGVEATVELVLEPGPDGPRARALSTDVVLPAFALDIDDSEWSGVAGDTARERLSAMYFIRSLTHDAIAEELARAVTDTVPTVHDAA